MTKYALSHRLEDKDNIRLHTGSIRIDLLKTILYNLANVIQDNKPYELRVRFYPSVDDTDKKSVEFICEVSLTDTKETDTDVI